MEASFNIEEPEDEVKPVLEEVVSASDIAKGREEPKEDEAEPSIKRARIE